MPVDPQIQALLDKGTGVPATHTLPVDVARAQYEARIALMAPAADIASVRERTIDAAGGPLRIRIYTPHGTGPFPLLVFFHGSGFVLCSLDTHDGMCRNLCAGSACVVASVDYRLAPEHKFPAGPEDCLHATRWAGMHAVELGADRTRIAVAGDSAGGNMAAVTAIRVRDDCSARPRELRGLRESDCDIAVHSGRHVHGAVRRDEPDAPRLRGDGDESGGLHHRSAREPCHLSHPGPRFGSTAR